MWSVKARFTVEFEIKEGNAAQRFTKTHIQKCANKGLPIEIKVEDKGLGKAKLVLKKTQSPTYDFLSELADYGQEFLLIPLSVQDGGSASNDEVEYLKRQLKDVQSKYSSLIKELSDRDYLTGCATLKYYNEVFELYNNGQQLSDVIIISVDIDGFKYINDEIGHTAGDYTLKMLADILKEYFNDVFRLADDDFTILTTGLTREEVEKRIDKVKLQMIEREEELKAQFTEYIQSLPFLKKDKKKNALNAIKNAVFSASFGISLHRSAILKKVLVMSYRTFRRAQLLVKKLIKRLSIKENELELY